MTYGRKVRCFAVPGKFNDPANCACGQEENSGRMLLRGNFGNENEGLRLL
jgi:hypothetical protein